jgi:hypothetical protein
MKILHVVLLALGCTVTGCSRHADSPSAGSSQSPQAPTLSQAEIAHVHELVRLYAKKEGGDDVAGPELQGMGTRARDEVIRMLDDVATPKQEQAAAIEILNAIFPSSKSFAAIDRFGSRISDPEQRKLFMDTQAAIRQKH